MTRPAETGPAVRLRRVCTDPALPVVPLLLGGALAASAVPLLTWAVIGGLAGHSLSGSV